VKNLFYIFILHVYLISTTELGQLLKLPFLITHYNEHKLIDETISFQDFILTHFSKEHSGHTNQHKKLPFKACTSNLVFAPAVISQLSFGFIGSIMSISKNVCFPTIVFILLKLSYSIWQPPKLLVF
jgi:hypothetical protein